MNIRNPGQDGADKGSAPENTGAGKAAPVHMYRVSLLILFFILRSGDITDAFRPGTSTGGITVIHILYEKC